MKSARILTALAIGGAALVAASPALAGTTPPGMGLAITPAAVSGPPSSHAHFVIKNVGTLDLNIRAGVLELRPVKDRPGSLVPYGGFPAALMTPDRFTLTVGASRTVTVTVRATDGLTHSLAIQAITTPAKVANGAAVSAVISAKYVITGKPNPYAAPVAATGTPQAGGLPTLWIALPIALLAALTAVWGLVLRSRRRRRSPAAV